MAEHERASAEPLTDAELAALADAAAKATPGPWDPGPIYLTFRAAEKGCFDIYYDMGGKELPDEAPVPGRADAAYIALACNAAPRLVAELRAAREENARLRETLNRAPMPEGLLSPAEEPIWDSAEWNTIGVILAFAHPNGAECMDDFLAYWNETRKGWLGPHRAAGAWLGAQVREHVSRENAALRARLDALVAALQTGRALADWFHETPEVYDKRHPKWKNAQCADDIAEAFREQADAAIAAARQEPAHG